MNCQYSKDELSVEQGCLLWGSRVIPAPGRQELLNELHECHPGIVRMKAETELKVRSCGVCQERSKLPAIANLHPWEWPVKAWYCVHIEYAGPLECLNLLYDWNYKPLVTVGFMGVRRTLPCDICYVYFITNNAIIDACVDWTSVAITDISQFEFKNYAWRNVVYFGY